MRHLVQSSNDRLASRPGAGRCVPAYPDGDYFAFLSEDFSEGTFGHPLEETEAQRRRHPAQRPCARTNQRS